MKFRLHCAAALGIAALPLFAQPSDSCSPGWNMLNQLREQLTPDTSNDTLALLRSKAESRLRVCRNIADLWYYRYLIAQRLNNSSDATYSLKLAKELDSAALRDGFNPFNKAPSAPTTGPLSKAIHEKWALVVGVGQFQDASHIQKLSYTVSDATAFASMLSGPNLGFKKDHVLQLVDGQATLLGIRTAIGQLREKVTEDDLLVVYMASHGSPRQSDPNGVSYVLTYDTKIDSAASLYATSLQMVDLAQLLKRDIRARRLVLILDTCFSGDATGARGAQVYSSPQVVGSRPEFSTALEGFAGSDGRVAMSASRADQESWESARLQHGYFTYFLMEALRQNDGKIPLGHAFSQAREQTMKAVAQDHPPAQQEPTIQQSPAGGAIVLGAPTVN